MVTAAVGPGADKPRPPLAIRLRGSLTIEAVKSRSGLFLIAIQGSRSYVAKGRKSVSLLNLLTQKANLTL